ncbi:MAG: hypothetical protein AAF740_07385, partial [Bacteroidota bacterium]
LPEYQKSQLHPYAEDQNYQTLKSGLRRLDQEDYIRFYEELDWIELKRRGILYARAKKLKNTPSNVIRASGGRGIIDFDDIFMPASADVQKSLTYDLKKKQMKVYGVDSLVLKVSYADTMILRAKPVPGTPVIVGKNRRMTFNGEVVAKAFTYHGEDFTYDYEDHSVDMQKIDSITFRVITDSGLVTLPNNIKATAGILYVDIPNNKSQLRYFKEYPSFKTTKQSKVTFAGREIMDGLYQDTSEFRFVVDTFAVTGVGRADPMKQKFRGTFYSDAITDVFIDSIGIREDGSLGFSHDLPEEGFGLYDSKARLYNGQLVLDNSGLRATFDEEDPNADTTEVHYLAARLQSNDFLLLPDSLGMEANGERAINRYVEPWDSTSPKIPFTKGYMLPGELNGVSFPEATFNGYELAWRVKKDSMNIIVKDEPFTLYQTEDRITNGFIFQNRTDSTLEEDHNAALVLRSDGLFGDGELLTDRALIRTRKFDFEEKEFRGDEAQFLITDPSHQITEVGAENVSFEYLLGDRIVNIETNKEDENSQFRFPKLEYVTSLGNAVWSIDQGTIAFRVDETSALEDQRFTSVKEGEGGLSFQAGSANYDLTEERLRLQGVPVIEVLDSRIYPNTGSEIVIQPLERMLPLEGAEIRLGYLIPPTAPEGSEPGSHVLTDASVEITSKTRFKGSGQYNFYNEIGELQQIRLKEFTFKPVTDKMVEDSVRKLSIAKEQIIDKEGTTSSTEIKESDNFIVEEGKIFRGQMIVRAWKLKPDFVGDTRLVLEGEGGIWQPYNTETGQTEVNLDDGKKETGVVGLFFSSSGRFYPLLNKPLTDRGDKVVMLAQGVVEADMSREVVMAIPKAKENNTTRKGNFIEYTPKRAGEGGEVYFEGKFNLLEGDNDFMINTVGRGRGSAVSGDYTMDLMLALGSDKKKETFKVIGEDLEEYLKLYRAAEGLEYGISPRDEKLLFKIAELKDDKAVETFQRQFSRKSDISGALDDLGLVFNKVVMKWDSKRGAFYSYGKIGIANAYKSYIDVQTEGYIELIPDDNPRGPALTIYFEVGPDKWYYIKYDGKKVFISSSNTDLNAMLEDPKANKDKYEVETDPRAREAFISRFRGSYGDHGTETDLPDVGDAVK